MRTTVDLPSDLMHAAKVKAAHRGESLKELLTRALEHEVRSVGHGRATGRLSFPLIGRNEDPKADLTPADIEAALAAEDIEKYGQ